MSKNRKNRKIPESESDRFGNTETITNKQGKQLKKYTFTWNNYEIERIESMNNILKELCSGYFYGFEVGKLCGTKHIQGFLYLRKAMRITELKKFDLINKFHFEEMKGNLNSNFTYCSKEGDIVMYGLEDKYNKWKSEQKRLEVVKNLKPKWMETYDDELILINPNRGYQKFIIDIINVKPDNRAIYWFYDKHGNVGKSQFSKYLVSNYDAVLIGGNEKDLLFTAATFKSYIYIIDLPRSKENHVSYNGIEALKNGCFHSSKFESKMIVRNSPHIFIFCNSLPEIKNLSLDRWHIYKIKKNYDVKLVDIEKIYDNNNNIYKFNDLDI